MTPPDQTPTPAFPPASGATDLLRTEVRRFAETEIAPHAERWDEEGIFPRELFQKAGAVGLFGIRVAESHGGSGMDWWATTAAVEALAYSRSAGVNMAFLVQSDIATPIVAELGTPEQKQQFLAPAVAGEKIAALAISEPGGGSDVAAVQTTARRDGDDYVINGQKLWITNGTRADFLTLAVRTGGPGYKGISLLTFPTDTRGYSVGKKLKKVGHRSSDTAELFFADCRVPRRFLLGEENKGFYYIMNNFQGERLCAAIQAVASMRLALADAVAYCKERTAFGKPLLDQQVWRHKFAEHLTAVEAAQWLTYRAVDLMNRGQPAVREVTMAKLFASDLAQRVLYDCQQAHGGFGYTTEYPIGRLWADLRLYPIGAGTSEIMKEILAKDL
jgi:citronellyl-CoA dehydrogenase